MGNVEGGHAQIVGKTCEINGHSIRIKKQLGEGGYAFVFLVEEIHSGQQLALKRMVAQDPLSNQLAEMEVDIYRRLKHRNVVGYHGSNVRNIGPGQTEYLILLEFCPTTLLDQLQDLQTRRLVFKESDLLRKFADICRGVRELHRLDPPVVHRDLKIENILVGADRSMKICDFGSCTTKCQIFSTPSEIADEEEKIQKFSTASYRSPEMVDLLQKIRIDSRSDVWALGCVFYYMAFLVHPFKDGSSLQIIHANYKIPKKHSYSSSVVQIIKKMLSKSAAKRPTLDQILLYIDLIQEGQVMKFSEFLGTVQTKKPVKSKPKQAPVPIKVPKKKKDTTVKAPLSPVEFKADFSGHDDVISSIQDFSFANSPKQKSVSKSRSSSKTQKTEFNFVIPDILKEDIVPATKPRQHERSKSAQARPRRVSRPLVKTPKEESEESESEEGSEEETSEEEESSEEETVLPQSKSMDFIGADDIIFSQHQTSATFDFEFAQVSDDAFVLDFVPSRKTSASAAAEKKESVQEAAPVKKLAVKSQSKKPSVAGKSGKCVKKGTVKKSPGNQDQSIDGWVAF